MDEVQIHVVELQFPQTVFDGVGDVLDVGDDLCCDEEFTPIYTALLDGRAKFGLGLVHFGAVEMNICERVRVASQSC